LTRIESHAFLYSSLQSVLIPSTVQIIGSSCFSSCKSLSSISFESNSRLARIESKAFCESSLQSIVIPKNVQFIDGSAFRDVRLSSISIESENERFAIENDLLIDLVDHILIRNFSNLSNVTISASIKILGSGCLSFCYSLSSISFESNSQLTRIESEAFAASSLESIVIPKNVQILGSDCFSDCFSISSIAFESPSQLKRIESRALSSLASGIVIPSTILFVASDAIPNPFQIRLENCDSCPEFDVWQQWRMKRIAIDFRRILKFGSDLADLKSYLVDLSRFEERSVECGNEEVFNEMYERQDDGCLILVKLKSLSTSMENRDVEEAISKEVNLFHPCIAAPIGFVFSTESSGLRELKIVRLFVDGCSLREVILLNPPWWTPTAKAKVVAGIALGLRFLHSLGFVHGNLNSSNIVFDEAHRIQITNIEFEVQEGKFAINSSFDGSCDKRWDGKVDVEAFMSLLVEMTVGSPSALPDGANSERTLSEMIQSVESKDSERVLSLNSIVDILKKNKFQIEAGVDPEEVWEFVRWVEFGEVSCE
jgi:hypothetical protein